MKDLRILFIPVLCLLCACDLQAPAPFTNYGAGPGEGSVGVHTVVAGETLWNVAQRYHMEMRDIAMLNYLKPPFDLPPGTRLRLPPPLEYKVRPGDTLYQVSRLFNASTTDVVRLNNLQAPYALTPGSTLRLPSPPVPPPQPVQVALAPVPVQNVMAMPNAVPQQAELQQETLPPSVPYQSASASGITSEALPPPETQNVPAQNAPVQMAAAKPVQAAAPSHAPMPTQMQVQPVSYQPEKIPAVKQKITAETPPRSSSLFLRPTPGRIVSGYGPKPDGLHNDGINIRAPRGTPVKAAENGVVVYAGDELKGSGNLVLIRHEGRWMTAYAHMDGMKIHRGDVVKRGQVIGTVGNTGSVADPQLHFEIRRGTEAINPERMIEG